MSEKPEALRLADAMWAGRLDYGIAGEIAAELRRLHAENERLREAMRSAMAMLDKHEPEPAGAFAVLLLALNPELQSARGEGKS